MMRKKILLLLTLFLIFALVVPVYADDIETTEDGNKGNAFCQPETELRHPVALRIEKRYSPDVDYDTVMGWFCDGGYGFGQIMLALQTSKSLKDGLTAEDLLGEKTRLGGWGLVWQEYKLIGKEAKTGKPAKEEKFKDKEKNKGGDDLGDTELPDDDLEEDSDGFGKWEGSGPPPWANNKKDKNLP